MNQVAMAGSTFLAYANEMDCSYQMTNVSSDFRMSLDNYSYIRSCM